LDDQSKVAYVYWGTKIWTRVSRDDSVEDFANSFAVYFSDPAALPVGLARALRLVRG